MAKVVVGMVGLGTVGTGVVKLLSFQRQLALKKIAVRDPKKARQVSPTCPVTDNVDELIADPEIEVLVEVMGGEKPALEIMQKAIDRRKHIVTANKEVLAKHGPSLFAQAKENGVAIFFEAAVAGGIPLISTMHKGLEANVIASVTGILNGTTNFILSSMEESGLSFAEALALAQNKGFAEADPQADVDGHDVAYKLSILSALAFGNFVHPQAIYKEGIRSIAPADISLAKEFGYRIKLIGIAKAAGSGKDNLLNVRVHPMLVPLGHPLASVGNANNGILVRGNAVGEIVLVGPGAGEMPTASAVVGDLLNLASALQLPDFASYFQPQIATQFAQLERHQDFVCPYYLSLRVKDTPGVIGAVGTIFGAKGINIQTIIQRGVQDGEAEIIVITGDVCNQAMEEALDCMKAGDFLSGIKSLIRIFKPSTNHA